MALMDKLFIAAQYLAPQHLLSRSAGLIAESRWPWLKNTLIYWFIGRYKVNMQEALIDDPEEFDCFNDFFTRELKPGARTIDPGTETLVSPVDGAVSQAGTVEMGRIFQAKGHYFSLIDLLGGENERARPFMGGKFATIYLSPKDYHRVHMPFTGTLTEMIYIPGKLFSVNPLTAATVPNLWSRNERVVCMFDTEIGPMAVILVGAMIVAGMDTIWAGPVAPLSRRIQTIKYGNQAPLTLRKGDEMGRFRLGSTVILIFPDGTSHWDESALLPGADLRLGQKIGALGPAPETVAEDESGQSSEPSAADGEDE